MLHGLRVVVGPARSGKTFRLLDDYRRVLADGPPGSALWLSPTHRAVGEVRHALLDAALSGCFQPQCYTFDQFARRVLDASLLRARPLGPSLVRRLLRRLIAAARQRGELRYFAPIAASSGFLDLVVRSIQELKRLEVWPEELNTASRQASPKDRELALIYDRYQQLLTRHQLYDAQGRFWQARALLREHDCRPFEHVRHVFVDGFTDLTRTEHEMLEILSQRATSLSMTLPLETDGRRDDLFAKTSGTIAQLRKRHPELTVETLPRRSSRFVALDHLETHLFANPRETPAAADVHGLEIVPAAGVVQEIELLAQRIKQLLVEGDRTRQCAVQPGEILVVFRSLADYGELVRAVFAEFGVSVALGDRPSLGQTPLAAALVGWLRLARDDWPFRQLLTMLGHSLFRPDWPQWSDAAVAAAERIVYALQLPTGRQELLAGVEQVADRNDGTLRATARQALPLIERVAAMLAELPERARLPQWREALVKLASSAGLLRAPEAPADPLRPTPSDREVWDQLLAALAAHEHLSDWLGEEPPTLTLAEFHDHFVELLNGESLANLTDETGRVRVLSAEHARNLSAPYLFLAGLTEKAFPPAAREDCVLGELDASELIRAGLPLVPPAERSRYEMLLFYEMVTRATRQLVFSYPALDAAAQPLSPSPYLTEVEHACGAGRLARSADLELCTVPKTDEVLSRRQFRLRALSQALEGEPRLLTQLARHPAARSVSRNLLAGVACSRARQQGAGYGPFEGMLSSPASQAALAQRYGAGRCWTASQLEQYAHCPYQFFLDSVLKIEPIEELQFEVDYRGRGEMLHWVLSTLHKELNDKLGAGPLARQTGEEFRAAIAGLIRQWLGRGESAGPLAEGMLQIDTRRVSAWLDSYHAQHGSYDEQWADWEEPPRPAHFEVSFGPSRHAGDPSLPEGVDRLSSVEALELECRGEVIRFAGRIDRIDLGRIGGQAVFNIVDYKSGKRRGNTLLKSVLEGNSLQLPLYAMAAQQLLTRQGALPFRAAYWHVAADGYQEKEAVKFHVEAGGQLAIDPQWQTLDQQLRERVRSLVDGIRGGQFPMHSADDECTSRCAYRTVCRVNQARALGKFWQPPAEAAP